MTDAEREAAIRARLSGVRSPDGPNDEWQDEFLLRLLDAARAEIAEREHVLADVSKTLMASMETTERKQKLDFEAVCAAQDRAEAAEARVAVLEAAMDPDTLAAIADEIDCFKHSARAAGLRGIARRQTAALAKEPPR